MSIKTEKLSFVYSDNTPFEKEALSDINIEIDDNEFVGIIGHTGCGKSTLVQHFNGLLKATTGRVLIDDVEITGKSLKELRKKVGLVFQYPEHQLFEETVFKDIAFGLKNRKLSAEEEEYKVRSAAESVGIKEELLERSIYDLSGGEKRRVAIAGVLVMDPKILVLDEPAAGLDPAGRDEILSYIKKIHSEMHKTVILVSHSMDDIAKLVDRVVVMNRGKIVMDGKPSMIFQQSDELESIGLAVPQITYFMKKLNELYPNINKNCFTVEQARDELLKHMKGKAHV